MISFGRYINEGHFEMQTLGIPRCSMPQIAQADLEEFFAFLDKEGVAHSSTTTMVNKLRPTQSEYSNSKISPLSHSDFKKISKIPLLVSSDDYIADGHHRYLNAWNYHNEHGKSDPVSIYRINLSAHDLINMMKRFPRTFYKSLNEEGEAAAVGGAPSSVATSLVGSQEAGYGVFDNKRSKKKKKVVDYTNEK